MSLIYSETWQSMYTYLLGALRAAAIPGGALDAAVITGSGSPAPITVEEVCPPINNAPTLGIQFDSSRETLQTTGQGQVRQSPGFHIQLLVMMPFNPAKADAAREAKLLIEKWWNDQQGNGLGPVLRADPTLGGYAIDSTIDLAIRVGRSVTESTMTSGLIDVALAARADLRVY